MNQFYLPIVKNEITASIEREVYNQDDDYYITTNLERLQKINPTIAGFISKFAETTEDPIGSAFCAIIVYRLLESQAECNQMESELMI